MLRMRMMESDSPTAGQIFALMCLAAFVFLFAYGANRFLHPIDAQRGVFAPEMRTKTIALMPGQAFNAPNRQFRKIEIRSEYPLQIMTGPCHQDFTVQFFCESAPADLFVRDTRHFPLFMTPKANAVTITVTEF